MRDSMSEAILCSHCRKLFRDYAYLVLKVISIKATGSWRPELSHAHTLAASGYARLILSLRRIFLESLSKVFFTLIITFSSKRFLSISNAQ